ncbi:bifunctional 2-polyprenyl-6-hydroxyphenol methylase/3-demethylubiquinol 3-O-methyltransferase UbiG [Ferruginibacter sp.]|uniref:class I SAM-dependent methyltransferase n=1 Tax=Ferruginibacter sp. TaxID=1940288 RepID=UPI0019CBBC69|nr:class I SAM-dependent methyltransferase [Ferruginibacter sp.]MBC7625942.1 class I SAM-dependent methyltransferase [Ferruginibacter sp.]
MQVQPWFKNWFNSPYYHQLYFNRDEQEAAKFIDALISHLKPAAGAYMLDVACGKGRHAVHLSEKGFDVTGIDLSEDSIQEALLQQSDKLHFYLHDMRLPFWINYFDYALNFFTSFGYFATQREHDNAIRTIAQSLKKEGCFVLDYLNVHYAEDHLVHQFDKEIDGVNYFITKWFDETHFYKKISVEDEALPEPLIYQEKVAKFSLGDFTEMFAYQGLQIQEVFGDYHFGKYDIKKSPRLIMIARKI